MYLDHAGWSEHAVPREDNGHGDDLVPSIQVIQQEPVSGT